MDDVENNQLDPVHIVRDGGGHQGDELLQALMHLWESRHWPYLCSPQPLFPRCSLIEQKGKGICVFLDTSAQYVSTPVYFSDRDFKNYYFRLVKGFIGIDKILNFAPYCSSVFSCC